jgi:hypothetical protein
VKAFEDVAHLQAQDDGAAVWAGRREEVCRRRSMSQRIFSGASGMLTLIAA